MATATAPSLTGNVSEERLGELRGLADRFETIEHIKLHQFQDASQLIEYLDQKNYTNSDIVEAYHAFVEGETGTPAEPEYGQPDYPRQRARWEYAVQHHLTGHEYGHDYGRSELDLKATEWDKVVNKSVGRKEKDEKGKSLADIKTYAEFKALRAKNPKIPERAWIFKQHHDAYQWEKYINKYTDKDTKGVDTPEKIVAWEQDLTKIGLSRVKSKAQFDAWRIANKLTDLPDEVWEHRAAYKSYNDAEAYLRLLRRYALRKMPRGLTLAQKEEWKNDPRNKGLDKLTSDEEYKIIVNDYNQDVADKDHLSLETLKANKTTFQDWNDPERVYQRIKKELAEKAAAPTLTYGGMLIPPVAPKPYTPPPAADFSHPSGETSEKKTTRQIPIFGGMTIPREETIIEEDIEEDVDEETDEDTEAPDLSESPTPILVNESREDNSPDDDREGERSGGGPSMPSPREIKMLGNLAKAGGVGTGAGAGAAGATGAVAGGGAVVAAPAVVGGIGVGAWIAIGVAVIAVIALVIFLVVVLMGGQTKTGNAVLSFNKSGPAAVANEEEIPYVFAVSYSGDADDINVEDILPTGTTIVDEKTTKPYTFDPATGRVTWSVKKLQSPNASVSATPATTQAFDINKYTQSPYSLPAPSGESDTSYSASAQNLNDLGSFVAKHQSYLISKVKNNDVKYVDPFLLVIWTGAIEGSGGNPFSWNCLDRRANGQADNPNLGCAGGFSSGSWQVGYGIQVSQATSHLAPDFDEAYGAGSSGNAQQVASVGQKVLDASSTSQAGKITNPTTFPSETIPSLITKAQKGETPAQQALAVLLMDKELGAVVAAQEVAKDIAGQDNWRKTMEGWGGYYVSNMQTFSNRMKALGAIYTGTATSSNSFPQRIINLTIKSTNNDVYLTNIGRAQVIGARRRTGNPGGGILVSNAKSLNEIFDASAQNARIPLAFIKAIAKIESSVLTYTDEEVVQFSQKEWWAGKVDNASVIEKNDPLIRRGFAYNTCQYLTSCFSGADVRGVMQFEIQSWNGIVNNIPNSDGHILDRRYVKDNIIGAGILIRNKVTAYYPNVGASNWTEDQVRKAAGAYCGDPTASACMHGGAPYDDLAWKYYQEFLAQQ